MHYLLATWDGAGTIPVDLLERPARWRREAV